MSAALDFLRGDWTNDRIEVLAFARELARADEFASALDAVYFFEKPHGWTREYRRWVALGRPDGGFGGALPVVWDVVMNRTEAKLSPEAVDAITLAVPHCVTTTDAEVAQELAAAGLIDLDDVEWSDEKRTTVYPWTAAGRVLVAEWER